MDPAVVGLLGGITTVIGSAIGYLLKKRQTAAEVDKAHAQADAAQAQASQAISAAASALVQPLTQQITSLQQEVFTLRTENGELRAEVRNLRARVEEFAVTEKLLRDQIESLQRQMAAGTSG